ncbi:hypothetical protein ACIBO5_59455 [Nonomuraea angiospora]
MAPGPFDQVLVPFGMPEQFLDPLPFVFDQRAEPTGRAGGDL